MASQNHQSGLEVAADSKNYVPPHSTATQPYYHPPDTGAGRYQKTIGGLRPAIFWLWIAFFFVILASGIGGGVGGSFAIRNAKCANLESNIGTNPGSSSGSNSGSNCDPGDTIYVTTTRTRTLTAAPSATANSKITVPTDGFLELDCPSLDQTTIQAFGSNFRVVCGQDSPGPDIIAIVTYTLLDCARACAAYNTNLQSKGCLGATFNSYLAYVDAHSGTCWLKNRTAGAIVNGLTGVDPNTYAQVLLE